jgi:hypothetical protein
VKNNKKALILSVCVAAFAPQDLLSSSQVKGIGCILCNGNPARYCGRNGAGLEATQCLTNCSNSTSPVAKRTIANCLEEMSNVRNWFAGDKDDLERWHQGLGEAGRGKFDAEDLRKLDEIIAGLPGNTLQPPPEVKNPPIVAPPRPNPPVVIPPQPKPPGGSSSPKTPSPPAKPGGSNASSSSSGGGIPKAPGEKEQNTKGASSSGPSQGIEGGFSPDGYLFAHKDLLEALPTTAPDVRKKFALGHYERDGKREFRTFEKLPPEFTPEEYMAINVDLADVAPNDPKQRFDFAVGHFLRHGAAERRQYHLLPPGFTAENYLRLHPDVAALAPADPSRRVEFAMWHYIHHGQHEGRAHGAVPASMPASDATSSSQGAAATSKPDATESFSPDGYLYAHKDLLEALPTTAPDERRKFALNHYERDGKREFRTFEKLPQDFSPEEYLAINDDLAKLAPSDPKGRFDFAVGHYVRHGPAEGRQYHLLPPGFTAENYLRLHPDVAALAPGDPSRRVEFAMWHYLHHGKNEGRAHGAAPPPPPGPPPAFRPPSSGRGTIQDEIAGGKDLLKKTDKSVDPKPTAGDPLKSAFEKIKNMRKKSGYGEEDGDNEDGSGTNSDDDDW